MAFSLQGVTAPPAAAPPPTIMPTQTPQSLVAPPSPDTTSAPDAKTNPASPVVAPPTADTPTLLNPPKAATPPPTGPYSSKAAGVLGGAMGIVSVLAQRKAQAEAKKAQTAIMQVTGQNAIWDATGKQWQQFEIAHPDWATSKDPQVQQEAQMLRHAVQAAWTNRVNAYAQYTLPDVVAAHQAAKVDPTGKAVVKLNDKNKKSLLEALKGFVEGKITPETPQLILQSQLNQMHNADPFAQIPPPAPKDVLAYSKDQDQVKAQQAQDKLGDLYAAAGQDPKNWSPAIASQARQYQNAINVYNGKPPVQETLDQVKATALGGIEETLKQNPQAKITEAQWIAAGAKPPVTAGKPVTVSDPTGQYLIPTDENGQPKVTTDKNGQQKIDKIKIGEPKNTAAQDEAIKAQADWNAKLIQYKQAHPGATDAQAAAGTWDAMNKQGIADPATKAMIVGQSIQEASAALAPDVLNNFAYRDSAGNWQLRRANAGYNTQTNTGMGPLPPLETAAEDGPTATGATKPSYTKGDKLYPGSLTLSGVTSAEGAFNNALRMRLSENGIPKDQIAQIIGAPLYGPAQAPKSTVAPKASAPPNTGPSPSVGATVTYNGKQYKVVGIAGGQAQLAPINK